MLFEPRGPLPMATVRRAPRSTFARLAGDLTRWLRARGTWLRPRAIPLVVAALGLVAVVAATSYLSDVARHGWNDSAGLDGPDAFGPPPATIAGGVITSDGVTYVRLSQPR